MVTNRCSSSEASSARVSAVGSNRADSASENRILCFRKLNFAFSGSQRVFTGQEYIYCMHMSRDFGSYVADIARRRRESAAAQKPDVARPEGSKSKIASEARQPPDRRGHMGIATARPRDLRGCHGRFRSLAISRGSPDTRGARMVHEGSIAMPYKAWRWTSFSSRSPKSISAISRS